MADAGTGCCDDPAPQRLLPSQRAHLLVEVADAPRRIDCIAANHFIVARYRSP
ncbi:MAG: hypothetical protein AB7O24_13925 [Kofleriaceae bacterium]